MIRQRRAIKKPTHQFSFWGAGSSKPKSETRRKKQKEDTSYRCKYSAIPPMPCFHTPYQIHYLYGDLPVTEKEDTIAKETLTFNVLKRFKTIETSQFGTKKALTVQIEQTEEGTELKSWQDMVQKISNLESSELNSWGVLIKGYCERYEKCLQDIEKTKKGIEEAEQIRITEASRRKIRTLYEQYPCVHTKFRYQNSHIHATQITFNEEFIKDSGYTLSTLSTAIFQQGIPKLTSNDKTNGSIMLKYALQNRFQPDLKESVSPMIKSSLIMKCGYVKPIQAQTYTFITYEDGMYGLDTILTIVNQEEPRMDTALPSKMLPTEDFICKMSEEEKALAKFLANYYNISFAKRYTNIGKVCQIREIPQSQSQ